MGRVAYTAVVRGGAFQRFNDLGLIWADLEEVSTLCDRLGTRKDDEETTRVLWIAAVVIYCRCFQANRQLNLREAEVFPDDDLRQQHGRIMRIRTEVIAHPGYLWAECNSTVSVMRNEDGTVAWVNDGVNWSGRYVTHSAHDDGPALIRLIATAKAYVNRESDAERENLRATVRAIPHEQLAEDRMPRTKIFPPISAKERK